MENSMLAYPLEAFGGVPRGSGHIVALQLEKAFENDDPERVMRILQGVFGEIPPPAQHKGARATLPRRRSPAVQLHGLARAQQSVHL